jgi:hypothetical protein
MPLIFIVFARKARLDRHKAHEFVAVGTTTKVEKRVHLGPYRISICFVRRMSCPVRHQFNK